MIIIKILFWLSAFLIFHTLIGYPASLFIISKIVRKKEEKKDISLKPYVSVIVPAHNEEKVIEKKLENLINLNYPKELMEIIIASDYSTDNTNNIVKKFIENNKDYDIKLYIVNKRQGKTNAQNEAVKIAKGEILVFTDANSFLERDAINHLTSSFTNEDIIYVTGKLVYTNSLENITSNAEDTYWNYDLFMRKCESDIKTITAGNGAIYAIRKSEYIYFDPIESHDIEMPLYAGVNNKRAIFNPKAIAYEKAGENYEDEFKRKVRMFGGILKHIFGTPKKYNIFEYGWFSYFYFSHRTLRYSLFILHPCLFICNLLLIRVNYFYIIIFILQVFFYFLALIESIFKTNKIFFAYPYYYTMTLVAQLLGAKNQITGKSKPFWEKAESTR